MPIIILPSHDPTLFFPIAMGEEMAGTVADTVTLAFPVDMDEEMSGTVADTATIPFPIDVSD